MHVAVCVGISRCLHVTFAFPLILDNSPVHSFPRLGPEPSLKSGFPSPWLSFWDLHPGNGGSLHCSYHSPLPRPSFHTGQGRAPGREGAPEETRCKGREKKGARTTQVHSSLSSPTTPACNRPNHLGTLKYTPPTPSHVFAIRSIATREPCSIGEAGEVGGGLPSPGARASTLPTLLTLPSAAGGSFAKATGPRPRRLGVGAGGQASSAP